jgi:hypothetical protein
MIVRAIGMISVSLLGNNYGASSLIRSGWDVQSAGNMIFAVSVRRDRLAEQ